MSALLVGYARCSTDQQDLTAQRDSLIGLGVETERIYVDHGLTDTNRERPGLREAMAACRAGDTLVVTKLGRLARFLPDARAIADVLTTRHNIVRIDGVLGHEIGFLSTGRLDPQPAVADATLTESDGSVVPVMWRPFGDADESVPLYPAGVVPWIRRIADGHWTRRGRAGKPRIRPTMPRSARQLTASGSSDGKTLDRR